jgi:pimeloyl-ACP methyl ester carboxylesterase
VGDFALHIHCMGEGTPIVVFDAGLGNAGMIWRRVQSEVGGFSRACTYDRAGLGYSDGPTTLHHGNRQMARELYTLLKNAGQLAPYVLVGHSMGGMNIRLFADEHSDEVAGMVLVDAVGEDQPNRFWALLPAEHMAAFRTGVGKVEQGLDYDTFMAGFADLRATSRSFGDKPLVVLTRGKEAPEPGISPELAAQLVQVWRQMQVELSELSSNSLHLVARNSSHFIQVDEPKLVSAAVRAVVHAVRTRSQLDPEPLVSLGSKYEAR